jgi:hypothetical protein
MADLFTLESTGDVAAGAGGSRLGTALNTGKLRRKYNFGDRVSELNIAQDPFFRFVSKIAKNPTDDPEFKFTERRPSFHKRYGYVVDWKVSSFSAGDCSSAAQQNANATVTAANINTAGATLYVQMSTDYKSSGNTTNISGNSTNAWKVGGSGTTPGFYLQNQLVKINFHSTGAAATEAVAFSTTDYAIFRIDEVIETNDTYAAVVLKLEVVRPITVAAAVELTGWGGGGVAEKPASVYDTYDKTISSQLEPARSYVVGTAHGQGTGYPETWKDQPFSTGYGRTQIWKTAMAMDNTTRATVLKYEPNEFARVWKEKLIEHKWDIEQSLTFGSQYQDTTNGLWYTQGAVDFILSYGNVFSLDHTSKTQDEFLDDMSQFLDPRYNNANATLFFVDTTTYNWLHKLSGYFKNNLHISNQFRADMALTGKKKVFGVDISTISTPFGDMNIARNIHLDGSSIKILAINMKYCKYRPLVGNGLNRDTSVYVGVQTLENSGVDRRVDLIQTEAGMEWQMPEAHAYWA